MSQRLPRAKALLYDAFFQHHADLSLFPPSFRKPCEHSLLVECRLYNITILAGVRIETLASVGAGFEQMYCAMMNGGPALALVASMWFFSFIFFLLLIMIGQLLCRSSR